MNELFSHSTSVSRVLDQSALDILDGPLVLAVPAAPLGAPSPDIQPADLAAPSDLAPTGLLQQISMLPANLLSGFLDDNRAAITQVLTDQPGARQVAAWWGSLDPASRAELVESSPRLVGNLEGVPYSERNSANRSFLAITVRELTATIESGQGRVAVEEARRQLRMLESVDAALNGGQSDTARTLITLDVTGQGRAAIVLGNIRTADYVSFLIPGMFFSVEGQMGDWTDAAARLQDDQQRWLRLLSSDQTEAGSTVATVAWLGYHTPDLTNVGALDLAYEGRDLLADAVEGLQTLRKADQPYLSLLAHSYGSTAALMALTEYEFEVDALAMVGSPGSAVQSVGELHVRNGNVYVGEASWDPVPNSSFFGSDPGSTGYGAKLMSVDGGQDLITDEALAGSTGHNEYFGPATESMRNMALIAIDKGQYVSTPNSSPARAANR